MLVDDLPFGRAGADRQLFVQLALLTIGALDGPRQVCLFRLERLEGFGDVVEGRAGLLDRDLGRTGGEVGLIGDGVVVADGR